MHRLETCTSQHEWLLVPIPQMKPVSLPCELHAFRVLHPVLQPAFRYNLETRCATSVPCL